MAAVTPTLGCVIATPGRKSILHTLNSILYQGLVPGDDILIVGDGHHAPTKELVEAFGPPFRYVATRRTRDWGHTQANYGMQQVGGDYLVLQDDDDIFLPRAFDEMRSIIARAEEPRPIIGRVFTPFRGLLWASPYDTSLMDGHQLVVPNIKKKLGYLTSAYDGDQTFLRTSLEPYEHWTWADRVWALTRPRHGPTMRLVEHSDERCVWTFDGGTVSMEWRGAHWAADLRLPESPTPAEMDALLRFIACAGQGHDVWLTPTVPDIERWTPLLYNANYTPHTDGPSPDFIHEWPPERAPVEGS